jgi:protein-arginine kinase activator protein McsA
MNYEKEMSFMNVNIISDTIQEFNNERYYLCGNYFQRKGKRLHLAVYRFYNGDIPKGYHVHHKDNDRSNNDISNLEIKTANKHLSDHMAEKDLEEIKERFIETAIPAAAKWHGSEEGRRWHSEHAKKAWRSRVKNKLKCQWCGREFESFNKTAKFCSNNCKCTSYRKRKIA